MASDRVLGGLIKNCQEANNQEKQMEIKLFPTGGMEGLHHLRLSRNGRDPGLTCGPCVILCNPALSLSVVHIFGIFRFFGIVVFNF